MVSMIGKRVCRQFEGEWYVGHITNYDAEEDLYMVEYSDGDKEELEFVRQRSQEQSVSNWGGNISFTCKVLHPTSEAELREILDLYKGSNVRVVAVRFQRPLRD